jgi:anaphase-promoting complex subunit 3
MQLLSKIYKQTERNSFANDCCYASLKQNPFLWHSFVDLCNRGESPNAQEIFQIRNEELLEQMEKQLCHSSDNFEKNNVSIPQAAQQNHCTPNNNNNLVTIETIPTSDETPLNNASMLHTQEVDNTPYRKSFKYLHSNLSPVTPSFGVLPLHSPVHESLKQTTLFITPSPPLQQSQQQLIENSEKNNSNKKIRGNLNSLVSRKEISTTPLLNQSSNITPRTPQSQQQVNNSQNQSVRRSSRIFSNYSVKENNKSPKFSKFAQPRSPPRKTSKRVSSKSTKTTLNELNEKNCLLSEKEKIETITSNAQSIDLSNSYSFQQIQAMKRQSADGLMQLLQTLGEAYLHLQQYELDEAQNILENKIHSSHYKSSWVQSILAVIHHERREYNEACKIFAEVRKMAPFRTEYMEIYSTDLWHLQKETQLSVLAQDLMQHQKTSAVTWCVAGNCFSALKEHDTAIKFFNRAIQTNPDFAYAYTLLGHELVLTEELEKALSSYRKAILKDSRHYNAWYGIGTIYSKQERFQLAEVHYRHSLKINPKNSVILVHIGVMQFYLNKREQALQTLLDAIQIDPKNPLCKFHHASINFKMGKFQEALGELEELKQLVPKESVVYYLIGKIHKQLGNIDLALMHFSWATDLGKKLNFPFKIYI